jgi:mono/diheme cytochrome c family protein
VRDVLSIERAEFGAVNDLAGQEFALVRHIRNAEKRIKATHNRCAGCHGEQLKAFAGGPAFDLRRLRPEEHDRFVESVISGKDNMPSWYGILKPDEIEAIWAYIRATVDR